jgi:hypothetical protein
MRRMGIGLGVGINRSNYAQGIFGAYATRVVADGGVVEAGSCVDAVSGLLLSASLLLVPSGYKGGKLYAEIPTNGNGDLTWTRGGDGFRTNASGLIQRVPWNLVGYSEQFDNAVWTKFDTTVTANATISPNGTTTADKLVESATTNVHWLFQSTTTTSSLAMSCYMKKGERDWGLIRTRTSLGDRFAWFNLNTGVVGTVESSITASITNVGDGWYRCIVVSANPTTSANPFVIGLSNADNVSTYTGNGTSGIFIWGAQLVEGTTAQTYLPTTDRLNFPRLSYMYGSCPAVLLEPQRTNLALYSEQFDNASWTKTALTITANSTTAPDGNATADTIVGDGSLSSKSIIQTGQTLTIGTTYTTTIYAKKNTNNFIQIVGTTNVYASGTFANYDLNSGVVGSTGGVGVVASIQNVGNGWYRCVMTAPAVSTSSTNTIIYQLIASATSVRAESNTLTTSVYLWGAQLEAGAYPTTYIPTTSATATRVADSFSRSNIYTNGLITSSGGTWFVELRGNISYTRDSASGLEISNASLTQRIIIYNTGGSARLSVWLTGTGVAYITTTDTVKLAIKWNGSNASVFANGIKVANNVTFAGLNMENLIGGQGVPFFIQQMALYTEPLTDTKLIELTTL